MCAASGLVASPPTHTLLSGVSLGEYEEDNDTSTNCLARELFDAIKGAGGMTTPCKVKKDRIPRSSAKDCGPVRSKAS